MRRAAFSSHLKGNPLSDQMHALAGSIAALNVIFEASADTQVQIASTLHAQADVVAHDAIEPVHAGSEGIIAQLTHRLVPVVDQTVRAQPQTAPMRVFIGGGAALATGLALVASVSYAVRSAAGRTEGEISGHTVATAMAAGPGAAYRLGNSDGQ